METINFCTTMADMDNIGWGNKAEASLSHLITIGALSVQSRDLPNTAAVIRRSSTAALLSGQTAKALQFLKRHRAQSQISAQVLIWPPNGIIWTEAFITHMNERADPGHRCWRTCPPTDSKDGWKFRGLREKTLSHNPPLPFPTSVFSFIGPWFNPG